MFMSRPWWEASALPAGSGDRMGDRMDGGWALRYCFGMGGGEIGFDAADGYCDWVLEYRFGMGGGEIGFDAADGCCGPTSDWAAGGARGTSDSSAPNRPWLGYPNKV
jgi:hypothetical protein